MTLTITPVQVALSAAEAGFPTFPTNPSTKKPYISDWPNRATTDKSKIVEFWTLFPDAMAGVVTGVPSGYFVLDIDVEENEDPFEKLAEFEKQHGNLPKTMTVKTPSGGLHLYFKMPLQTDLRNSASKIGHGIDIRANGGYVIYPGSTRSDNKTYQLISKE